ncbi:MAG: (d)CMP kinase [Candidatus Aadella gelida]|nr:(d)CMP kinase [Candidatus Aadella gelida]
MIFFRKPNAVAIDGPAGSGKSTISRLVADRLGYTYVDTGAMYRALTLKVMKKGIEFSDEKAVSDLSAEIEIRLLPSEDEKSTIRVMLDGEDVSSDIRMMQVTSNVKYVAKIPKVRGNLVKLQREMVRGMDGSVMEGRDIGTVVLPNSKYKFYVDASFEERVERRFAEMRAKGLPATRSEVADDLKQRDHTDKTRKVGPLKRAEDAVYIDTTKMSIEEVVNEIAKHVK